MKQAGFSLVEVLIACLLAAVVTTGVINAYLGIKKVYVSSQTQLQLQQKGGFAFFILNRLLQPATGVHVSASDVIESDQLRLYVAKAKCLADRHRICWVLYQRLAGQQRGTALLSGVVAMKVRVGVVQQDQMVYLPAQQVSDWQHIRSLVISLQLKEGTYTQTWPIYIDLKNYH